MSPLGPEVEPVPRQHGFPSPTRQVMNNPAQMLPFSHKDRPSWGGFSSFGENPRSLRPYLILASLNSTCFFATGSYFLNDSLSVFVREFFFVT